MDAATSTIGFDTGLEWPRGRGSARIQSMRSVSTRLRVLAADASRAKLTRAGGAPAERIVNWCLVQNKSRVPEWHVLYEVK